MNHTLISRLPSRAIIRIGGPQRLAFLDGLLTCAIDQLTPGALAYGALLTPQGKIISDMMVFADADTLALDVPESARDDLVRRLTLYKLRAAVTIEPSDEIVAVSLDMPADTLTDTPASTPADTRPDPRGPGLGARLVLPAGHADLVPEVVERYTSARIAAGVPDAVVDFTLGDAFPHDVNMDFTHGVDFKKGCFVGQEVVSRMRHRGTARRRTVIVEADTQLPETGTPIERDGRPVGRLGTSEGRQGLATVRIDKVGAVAQAGDVRLAVRVPEGATFALAEI